LFAQGVSEGTGSKTAGTVAEAVVGVVAGGGLKDLVRGGASVVRGLLGGSAKRLAAGAGERAAAALAETGNPALVTTAQAGGTLATGSGVSTATIEATRYLRGWSAAFDAGIAARREAMNALVDAGKSAAPLIREAGAEADKAFPLINQFLP
jgi:hypothetical protein